MKCIHAWVMAVSAVALFTASAASVGQRGGDKSATAAAVSLAQAFLNSLNTDQRPKASYPYESDKKSTWHNLPPTMAPRAGIMLGELTPQQRNVAMTLLQTILSPYGYQKVVNILDADKYLGEHNTVAFPTGPAAYSIAVYGTPSNTAPWMLQVNGHHLGLNVTLAGGHNAMTPSLTGSYPDLFERDGRTVRALGDETDRAFALMQALTPEQQKAATLPFAVDDLVLPPGMDGKRIEPEGLNASAMTGQQRDMLLSLTSAWVNILNADAAAEKMSDIRRKLANTYFAWSGATVPGSNAYFRVQGPTLFIEYAPQVNPGTARTGTPNTPGFNNVGIAIHGENGRDMRQPNHIHTVFRDFTNEYGRQFSTH